jgi:hypothetical protein
MNKNEQLHLTFIVNFNSINDEIEIKFSKFLILVRNIIKTDSEIVSISSESFRNQLELVNTDVLLLLQILHELLTNLQSNISESAYISESTCISESAYKINKLLKDINTTSQYSIFPEVYSSLIILYNELRYCKSLIKK